MQRAQFVDRCISCVHPVNCARTVCSSGASAVRFTPVTSALSGMAHRGFTIVELLVTMAVAGLLLGISIPAVQKSREAARWTQCRSNLRQIGQALHNFEAAHKTLPAGVDFRFMQRHSWCTWILPYLGEEGLHRLYDWDKDWDDPASNLPVTSVRLPVFVCPSASSDFSGEGDYGGNYGSSLTGLRPGTLIGEGWESGALVATHVGFPGGRKSPTRFGEFTDGLSSTFLVLESCDRPPENGSWGIGTNCLAIELPINHPDADGETILSSHPQGGHALFCDGHVSFLNNSTDLEVLGRLSTRHGQELAEPWK